MLCKYGNVINILIEIDKFNNCKAIIEVKDIFFFYINLNYRI